MDNHGHLKLTKSHLTSLLSNFLETTRPPYPWVKKQHIVSWTSVAILMCSCVQVFVWLLFLWFVPKNKSKQKRKLREEIKSSFFSRNSQRTRWARVVCCQCCPLWQVLHATIARKCSHPAPETASWTQVPFRPSQQMPNQEAWSTSGCTKSLRISLSPLKERQSRQSNLSSTAWTLWQEHTKGCVISAEKSVLSKSIQRATLSCETPQAHGSEGAEPWCRKKAQMKVGRRPPGQRSCHTIAHLLQVLTSVGRTTQQKRPRCGALGSRKTEHCCSHWTWRNHQYISLLHPVRCQTFCSRDIQVEPDQEGWGQPKRQSQLLAAFSALDHQCLHHKAQ